jgi:hypothetical protein
MKFKQNLKGEFICEECKKPYKNLIALSKHIHLTHFPIKDYYKKYILSNNEDICKICGKENSFKGLVYGYTNGCCKEHMNILGYEKRKESLLKNYGVENPFQRSDLKDKMKKTWIKNYGVDNPNKSKDVRNKLEATNIKKYGSKCALGNKDVRKKSENTCKKHYGAKNPFSSEVIKEKIKNINIEKYGVENPLQNREIFNKAFKTRILIKKYKNTNLFYQASYEYDFLEKFYTFFPDIENGPSIKYIINKKNKIYHSDFYIPSLNLVIEIKNHYLLNKYRDEILLKEKATKSLGYNFILIVNKHYKHFIKKYVKNK